MGDARHRITRDRFLQKQRGARDNARHDVGIRISRYVEALRRPFSKFLAATTMRGLSSLLAAEMTNC